ncbi:hydroxymethylbilane synthase [Pullulanibacillus pueri]|uniref:Porphobilinogen deaminase n=1 Tax=Pullulanibacillus pueri TaxID=1437324 RepID=A0A8J3A169_9BACL|nr:hydroxymethylbilane synthase [Pullulanibacillus pueri]MBM7684242.1 hydroxymethylbilane synthase [Pullulanibacillus pueri]GGH89067.1 porphobilinogen deaminase [Pullulanibacillus pueri]
MEVFDVKINVGSRKSKLALTQTQWIMDKLKAIQPELEFELKHIITKGDRILDVTLSKVGGKGLFVKEIEQALFDKEIDFAVHSMKDMPAVIPEGLTIACVPIREDYRDALISREGKGLNALPEGAIVGTSSLRRQAQIIAARPDLKVEPLRGNIDTRIQKLKEGHYDAIILAAAGLKRMGWSDDIVTEYLDLDVSVSAVGQGALAIECRRDDAALIDLLKYIHDEETAKTVAAERAFLRELEGGCQVPIAAHCVLENDQLQLVGLVATPDGQTVVKESLTGTDPDQLGVRLANDLKSKGAAKILEDVKKELDES